MCPVLQMAFSRVSAGWWGGGRFYRFLPQMQWGFAGHWGPVGETASLKALLGRAGEGFLLFLRKQAAFPCIQEGCGAGSFGAWGPVASDLPLELSPGLDGLLLAHLPAALACLNLGRSCLLAPLTLLCVVLSPVFLLRCGNGVAAGVGLPLGLGLPGILNYHVCRHSAFNKLFILLLFLLTFNGCVLFFSPMFHSSEVVYVPISPWRDSPYFGIWITWLICNLRPLRGPQISVLVTIHFFPP